MKSKRMEGTRRHRTFVTLRECAQEALGHAEARELGSFHSSLSAILATVFTLEAFLNHIGTERHRNWTEHGERLPLRDKLKTVLAEVSVEVDPQSADYQLLRIAVNARDYWVHGKTYETEPERWNPNKRGTDRPWRALRPQEEQICEPAQARQLLTYVESLARLISEATGHSDDPFGRIGNAGATEVP